MMKSKQFGFSLGLVPVVQWGQPNAQDLGSISVTLEQAASDRVKLVFGYDSPRPEDPFQPLGSCEFTLQVSERAQEVAIRATSKPLPLLYQEDVSNGNFVLEVRGVGTTVDLRLIGEKKEVAVASLDFDPGNPILVVMTAANWPEITTTAKLS